MKNMHNDKDDSELKKRLQNYEEKPDDNLWRKIQSEISPDGDSVPLKDRLLNYTEDPDEFAWANVRSALDGQRTMDQFQWFNRFIAFFALIILFSPILEDNIYGSRKITFAGKGDHMITDSLIDKKIALEDNDRGVIESNKNALEKRVDLSDDVDKNINDVDKGVKNINSLGTNSSNTTNRSAKLKYGSMANTSTSKNLNALDFITEENYTDNKSVEIFHDTISPTSINSNLVELNAETSSNFSMNNDDSLVDTVHRSVSERSSSEALAFNNEIKKDSLTISKKQVQAKALLLKDTAITEHKPEEKKSLHKINIYALAMPTLGYQQIKPVKDDGILIESIGKVSAFSPKRLGIRMELGLEKNISSKVSVNFGLLYYQRKQTLAYTYLDSLHSVVTPIQGQPLAYEVSAPKQTGNFEYSIRNIGIVSGFNYIIKGEKFIQRLGIAAEFHKGLSQQRSYYVFGDVYYKVTYPVNKHVELIFQPTLNYALKVADHVDAPFTVKPYGLGLNFGICFKPGL
jgi:hypothetical protein